MILDVIYANNEIDSNQAMKKLEVYNEQFRIKSEKHDHFIATDETLMNFTIAAKEYQH